MVLVFSDAARDPRVHRHVEMLSAHYRVTVAAFGSSTVPGTGFLALAWPSSKPPEGAAGWRHLAWQVGRIRNVPRRLIRGALMLLGRTIPPVSSVAHDLRYWRHPLIRESRRRLAGIRADAIIANDLETLPLALRMAGNTPVIFDAHEYAPLEYEDRRSFRLWEAPFRRYQVKRYVPLAAASSTVCDGIAETYATDTGVRPVTITNAAAFVPMAAPAMRGDGKVRLIHHGLAAPVRRIENMIEMMQHLDDRFSLDLMLVDSGGESTAYLAHLRQLAAPDPRIRFRPPVSLDAIVRETTDYDVGLFLLEPTNFNYLHALPNKFFEFVQARLAIAIGPSPEMAALVRRFDLGVVASDFRPESLAASLNALGDEDLRRFRENAHAAARELSAETNRERLLELVGRVIGKP